MLHHSMIELPEQPMKPRRYDDRVGFFNETFEDYGSPNQEVDRVSYITRWRLEKKDPKAEVSEPKKPIVFYIGREVPAKWRPWIKKGVEAWQPAFEKAGFKDAILAKEPPSPREDPDWDAEDARYSSIRWLPSTIENAYGPHVHDPRTGEILESDIRMYHNVLKLVRDWYFVQASPNDPRAQSLPLPDDLIGELVAYVTSHEVGHTLGFRHNMKASSAYTVEQLRNPEFTKKNGVEASIMDYGRFNYVAQPGDGARLIPIIGPYDDFAVEWGYKEFPDAKTYEHEKKELDKIVARQLKDPKVRFGDPNPAEDPSQQTEDLGSDSIRATELGLKNIDRVAGFLVKATAKAGENYDLLRERLRPVDRPAQPRAGPRRQRRRRLDPQQPLVPRRQESLQRRHGDQQKKAVGFLNEHAFQTPKALIDPDILDRLESHGTRRSHPGGPAVSVAHALESSAAEPDERVRRRTPDGAYRPTDLMTRSARRESGASCRRLPSRSTSIAATFSGPMSTCSPRPLDTPAPTATCPLWPARAGSGVEGGQDRTGRPKAKQLRSPAFTRRHQEPRRASVDAIPPWPAQRPTPGQPVRRGADWDMIKSLGQPEVGGPRIPIGRARGRGRR